MKNIIQRIEELNASFQSLLPLQSEFQSKLDKKFRLEFNYNSNHLEGNTLTYDETELLLIFDETTNHHTFRAYEEMKAHDVALTLIKNWAADKERPLTETDIKTLNRTILVKPFWKDAITSDGQATQRQIKIGDYKEFPNSVRLANGEMFAYTSVIDTPIEMGQLIDWYRTEEHTMELHPVTLAALLHYKFVKIHPFDDGNGRIARLLTNYVLLKHNLPLIVIKSADKRNYLAALHQADAGNLDAFVAYIAKQVVGSLKISLKAAQGKSLNEPDDSEKEISLSESKISVLEDKNLKSKASILFVWNNCLYKVLDFYLQIFLLFERLFRVIEINFQFVHVNNDLNVPIIFVSNKMDLEQLNEDIISGNFDYLLLKGIRCDIFFNDFKKMNFSLSNQFSIHFDQKTYKIIFNNLIIKKKYNQVLEKAEIHELIHKASEQFFNEVEAQMDKLS
jgi:Fic family protein